MKRLSDLFRRLSAHRPSDPPPELPVRRNAGLLNAPNGPARLGVPVAAVPQATAVAAPVPRSDPEPAMPDPPIAAGPIGPVSPGWPFLSTLADRSVIDFSDFVAGPVVASIRRRDQAGNEAAGDPRSAFRLDRPYLTVRNTLLEQDAHDLAVEGGSPLARHALRLSPFVARRRSAAEPACRALKRPFEERTLAGIVMPPAPAQLAAALTRISISSVYNKSQFPMLLLDSHDELLRHPRLAEADYALFIMGGNWFRHDERWLIGLASLLDTRTLAVAHIREEGDYFALDPQCIFLNLALWNRIGRPGFADAADAPVRARRARSSGVRHPEDQGPAWLEPAEGDTEIAAPGFGWQLIAQGLQHGLRIASWPDYLRREKAFIDPANAAASINEAFAEFAASGYRQAPAPPPGPPADKQAAAALQHALSVMGDIAEVQNRLARKVYTWNTETIDTPKPPFFAGAIDQAVGVASGLKLEYLLHRHGFHERTRVDFFDLSSTQLALRRHLVEEWDGRDYGGMLRRLWPQLDTAEVLDEQRLARSEAWFAEVVTRHFGGWDGWAAFWARYRRLSFTFTSGDMTLDTDYFMRTVSRTGRSLVWWSGMFQYPPCYLRLFPDELRVLERTLARKLVEHNPEAAVIVYHYEVQPFVLRAGAA
ncbi:MAG: hypothetical protein JO267_09815 [Alphaproteobacteria bacterium]|nr:hypothetical protein [Alphaproteobacteria bacterium]